GDTVTRFGIPRAYLYEMIDGVSTDLEPRRIATFDELYRYCYQVASVVGLATIHVFGFDSPDAPLLAEKCGVAFQLTNILRDVREDADRGRVYVPAEDLARFGVEAGDLRPGAAFRDLLRFEADRARRYYDESRPLLELVDPPSRPALRALVEIYSRLLQKVERAGDGVLQRRVSLSVLEKCWIVARAQMRQ
ncbi:MAG: phytoene/squalene synthase family protein, partial [Bryobacteraceae bacterium]